MFSEICVIITSVSLKSLLMCLAIPVNRACSCSLVIMWRLNHNTFIISCILNQLSATLKLLTIFKVLSNLYIYYNTYFYVCQYFFKENKKFFFLHYFPAHTNLFTIISQLTDMTITGKNSLGGMTAIGKN